MPATFQLAKSASRIAKAAAGLRRRLEWLRRPAFDVAESVIRLRRLRGFSQADLAERMGTKQPAIARLESGLTNPRVSTLVALARALDATVRVHMTPAERLDDGFRFPQWWALPDDDSTAVRVDNTFFVRADLKNYPEGTFVLANRSRRVVDAPSIVSVFEVRMASQTLHKGLERVDITELAPPRILIKS